jgi:hypothetical protein
MNTGELQARCDSIISWRIVEIGADEEVRGWGYIGGRSKTMTFVPYLNSWRSCGESITVRYRRVAIDCGGCRCDW